MAFKRQRISKEERRKQQEEKRRAAEQVERDENEKIRQMPLAQQFFYVFSKPKNIWLVILSIIGIFLIVLRIIIG